MQLNNIFRISIFAFFVFNKQILLHFDNKLKTDILSFILELKPKRPCTGTVLDKKDAGEILSILNEDYRQINLIHAQGVLKKNYKK